MAEKLTLEDLHAMAERAGLKIADDELERLLPGVNRARQQAAELREMLQRDDEPAGLFRASQSGQR